jgi:predicted PurR-regulated permease PerM
MRDDIPVRRYLAAIWLTIASLALVGVIFVLRHLLFDLLVAVFLAIVLNVPVRWLVEHKIKRGFAVAITMIGVLVLIAGIAAAIATPLAGQAANVAKNAPTYLGQAEKGRGPIGRLASRVHLQNQLKRLVPTVSRSLSKLPSRALAVGRGVASSAARTAIVLVLTVFVIVEGPSVVAAFERMIPRRHLASTRRIGEHIAQTVSSYTIGILVLAALNGIVTGTALATMRVPFVLPLSMWAGLVDILPIVGGLLAMFVVSLFAFTKSLVAGIVVVVVMFVYQQVKNHFLYPVVVGRAVRLNSLVVLLAVLAGVQVGGVAGAIFAIPVAAVVHVVLTEFLGPRIPWLAEDAAAHTANAPPPPAAP